MKPSSCKIRKTSIFSFDAETSKDSCFARLAFRTRVKRSAIGSLTGIDILPSDGRITPPRYGIDARDDKSPNTGIIRSRNTLTQHHAARLVYQLDLVTPGIRPRCASSRKQIRQMLNLRMYPWARPQSWQRLYARTANRGLSFAFSIRHCLAKFSSVIHRRLHAVFPASLRPKRRNRTILYLNRP